MNELMDRLYSACMWISGIAVVLMSLIIPWGVFARYVLGSGSQWPEPISILLMAIFTFLGAAVAYRAGSHIAVEMLTGALPAPIKRIAALVSDLLVLGLCCFLVFYGGKLVLETMNQTIAAIPWMPVGITYLALPVGGLVTLCFVLEKLISGSQHERAIVRFDHGIE